MLEVNQVYKTFNPGTVNEKRALNGVNLTLKDGDLVTAESSLRAKLRNTLPRSTSPMITAARPMTMAPRPLSHGLLVSSRYIRELGLNNPLLLLALLVAAVIGILYCPPSGRPRPKYGR